MNAIKATPAAPVLKMRTSKLLVGCAAFLAIMVATITGFEHWRVATIDYNIWQTGWFQIVVNVARALLVLNLIVLAWRIYLFKTYKPMPACADKDLPSITVLVPAYNEGAQVLVTLRSICQSDYPVEKMQIISIDDGSKDDTWEWMVKAKEELGSRVEIIKQPQNGGKRHALYTGFQRAIGRVWITIDSDSVVEPWGLRNLVSPFVHDARVGGVGGNVRVLNWKEGFIPKILEVAFTFGFDFVRASHSRVNTVMCTPGALSAFRASAVRPVMDEWLNEKFLGKPYNIGEDRNLTNLVLRQGFHVLFQSNANVFTNVPTTYKGLCKMLTRWARSDVRESLMLSGFAFKNFRPSPKAGARVNLALSWIDMSVTQLVLLFSLFSLLFMPLKDMLLTLGLLGLGAGAAPVLVYFWRHHNLRCLWGIPYVIFYFLALSWIQVYAFFTVHRSGWLTRQIAQDKPRRVAWRLIPKYALASMLAIFMLYGTTQHNMDSYDTPLNPTHQLVASAGKVWAADNFAPVMADSEMAAQCSWYITAQNNLGERADGLIHLSGVELVVTRTNGGMLRLQGNEANYNPRTHELYLQGNVQGVSNDGIIFTAANTMNFSHADFSLGTSDEVLLTGPALNIKSQGMRLNLVDNRTYFVQEKPPLYNAPRPASKVFATLG